MIPSHIPFSGLARLLAVLCSLLLSLPALGGEVLVDMLDVGQGDAILLRSPEGKAVLIDAGDGRTDIVAELQGRGVSQLDLVVVTHGHSDHLGGMEDVIRAMPVGVFMDSGVPHTSQVYQSVMQAVEESGLAYAEAEAGQRIQFGQEATIEVLWPAKTKLRGTRSDLNANSVVLRLVHGENCFLFVGDAEEETEVRLQVRGLEQCSVIKVAHHGSNHSTTDRYLSKLKPTIALISVGDHNRYNHPGEECLRRLERHGVAVYRTDQSGAIRVVSTGRSLEVQEGIVTIQAGAVAPPRVQAATDEGPADHESDSYGTPGDKTFVASKKSEVFHEPGCEWAQKINPDNLVTYDSYQAAVDDGRRPARCCNPTPDSDQ